jgi:ABC-2 type transport system permease protein
VNVAVLNLVCLGLSFAVVEQYAAGEDLTNEIWLFMGAMFIVQLVFLFLGSAIAAVGQRPKAAASIATTVMLTTYVISIVVDINENLGFLRYLTPFKYFAAAPVLDRMGYEPVYLVLSAAIIAVSVGVTYLAYDKRDLKI